MAEIFYFDMDGVLADFEQALRKLVDAQELPQPPKGDRDFLKRPLYEPVRKIISTSEEFWLNLDPYPEGLQAFDVVGDKGWVCTSPGWPVSATPKAEWCKRHLGIDIKKIVLAAEKWQLAKKDRFLIDDQADNCNEFLDAGGQAILVERAWSYKKDEELGEEAISVRPQSLQFVLERL